jgi:hypothetical protein
MQGIIDANKGSIITSGRGNFGDRNGLINERIVHEGFDRIRRAVSVFRDTHTDAPRP